MVLCSTSCAEAGSSQEVSPREGVVDVSVAGAVAQVALQPAQLCEMAADLAESRGRCVALQAELDTVAGQLRDFVEVAEAAAG